MNKLKTIPYYIALLSSFPWIVEAQAQVWEEVATVGSTPSGQWEEVICESGPGWQKCDQAEEIPKCFYWDGWYGNPQSFGLHPDHPGGYIFGGKSPNDRMRVKFNTEFDVVFPWGFPKPEYTHNGVTFYLVNITSGEISNMYPNLQSGEEAKLITRDDLMALRLPTPMPNSAWFNARVCRSDIHGPSIY